MRQHRSADELGIHVRITTNPVEVESDIPFDQDQVHSLYDAKYVTRWWRVLLQVDRLLQQFRTPFVGRSSPVLFWWGSFDISETRFSGRPAPEREWPARWMRLGGGAGAGLRRILARVRKGPGAGLFRLYVPGASRLP